MSTLAGSDDAIRAIAQSDPVPMLTARWGRATKAAGTTVERLTADLRELDTVRGLLAKHGLTVAEDLGPIGNAAQAARRDLERERPGNTFRMPDAD